MAGESIGRVALMRVVIALCCGAVAVCLLVGCGGSGNGSTASTVSSSQLQAARRQGEARAEERDQVAALQRQVRAIKRRLHRHPAQQASPAVASAAEGGASAAADQPMRSFHAPSGNISCEVFTSGATCTVESSGETFVLEAGSLARVESAAVLSPELGEVVEYGHTVGAGSIICEVPPSDVPRGVTCIDQSDGHGFEASRDASRQEAY